MGSFEALPNQLAFQARACSGHSGRSQENLWNTQWSNFADEQNDQKITKIISNIIYRRLFYYSKIYSSINGIDYNTYTVKNKLTLLKHGGFYSIYL